MSHQKWNVLFVLLLLLFATATASAQVESARFFAPYQYDQFGGGGRMPEGFFGSLNMKYATIARGPTALVGLEGTRRYLDNSQIVLDQVSNLNTDQLETSFNFGTEAEIGHICGHHGWVIGGYGMRGITGSASGRNASLNIQDSLTYNARTIINTDLGITWNRALNDAGEITTIAGADQPIRGNGVTGVGYLWGWYPSANNGTSIGVLAPLPVTFDRYRMENTVDHWSMEAMYMYRCHPTRMGTLELFGGVRYLSVDDTFRFRGMGSPWTGVTQGESFMDTFPWDLGGAEEFYNHWLYQSTYLEGTATGVGSALGNASWSQQAQNHIVAPQVSLRFTKRCGRWSLIADAKAIFGFNSQNKTITGFVSSYSWQTNLWTNDIFDPTVVGFDAPTGTGVPLPWTPVGVNNTNSTFRHRRFSSEFSPGVEGKLSANFQATNAVGILFGVEGLWMDKIARGSLLNSYAVDQNGTFFGISDNNHMSDFLMYGFRFGVTINR